MPVDSSSIAKASVIALRAVFDGLYTAPNAGRCGLVGSAFSVSEPEELDTLTIRAAGALRRSGSIACVTATTPNTFVSNTARTSSSDATLGRPARTISWSDLPGAPAFETPALFTRTSRRPSSVRMALCRRGDGSLIRDVELEGASIRPDALRGCLPLLDVARADEYGEAVRREILRDLEADS